MQSIKMNHVISNLVKNYYPFNLLSENRSAEVANLVRFIELQEGETFQIKGSKGHDYLFLVEGAISLVKNSELKYIPGPEATKNRPIVLPSLPAITTLIASTDAIVCHVNREMLDSLMSWDGIVKISSTIDDELHHEIERVRNSLVFRRLPLECVEAAFSRMFSMKVKAGDTIINYGEPGDAFYVITDGKAEVFQKSIYDDQFSVVAELGIGDAFGHEALVTGKARNETVKMVEDGKLLVLREVDFNELITKPLVQKVNPTVAHAMVASGYQLLDVRYEEEHEMHHIPNSKLIPLHELHTRLNELDPNDKFIVYCHSGARSGVATLMMIQSKFDTALSLDGGIRDWPFETVEAEF